MDSNKMTIWALQLMRYLIGTKGYLQVSVVTNYEPGNHIDFWLVKPEPCKFPVVHISDESDEDRSRNLELTSVSAGKIMGLVNSKEGRCLDISFHSLSSEFSVAKIKYIHLHPGCEVVDEVADELPDMSKVIHDVDGDPAEVKKKLERELAFIAMTSSRRNRPKRKPLDLKANLTPLALVVCIICVIMCAAVNGMALWLDKDNTSTAIFLGCYYKAYITIFNQWWRLLTAGFIHISILHLLCNLFSFVNLSKITEKYYGLWKSVFILLASIVVGNLCVFIGDANIAAVGLSGGIFGLFGAYLVIFIQNGHYKNPELRSSILRTIYMNMIISLMPNVSLLAHLGGLVCGIFLGVILSGDKNKFIKINFAICGVIILGALGYMAYRYNSFIDFYYGTDLIIAEIWTKLGFKNIAENTLARALQYYLSHGG